MTSLTVWLNDIDAWDIKSAKAAEFRNAHPDFKPLGEFAEEATELVRPMEQPEKSWAVYGVSNTDGVFLNSVQPGSAFRSPQKKIIENWFFHNPTRANVGSMARVGPVQKDAITSPEYQVWRVKPDGWLVAYVEILIRMPFFNYLVHIHRVGGVKERLYVQNLLQIPVPDRPTEFQREIVSRWSAAQREIDRENIAIEKEEALLVDQVLKGVGISIDESADRPKAFSMELKDIERWGVGFNRSRWTLETLVTSNQYPCSRLGSVADINPARTKALKADDLVSFVPMEAVSHISGSIEEPEDVTYSEVSKGYTPFEDGDVIWAKITPCMENGKLSTP